MARCDPSLPVAFYSPPSLFSTGADGAPYCNMQLSDLRLVEPKLREQGFEIVFLSTDRPEILYSSLKAADIHYTLLSDSHLEAAKAFHVAYHLDDATRSNTASISMKRPAPLCTSYRYPRCSSSTRRVPYATSTRIPIIRFVSPPMRFWLLRSPMRRGAPRRNRRSQCQTDFRSNLCLPRQPWRAWARSVTWAGACSMSMSPMISMGPWCFTAIGVKHAGGGRKLAGILGARRVGHCRRER
jgi:AhpC/TSA family